LKIEQIDIDKIIPYINNPRKNLNSDKVASSIKEFGFQQPIVVDKDMSIIVGHTRYEAAKKLDLKTVPVVIADLPPLKAKAYRIADNRLNQDSLWDFSLLNIEFTDLLDNHYDLDNLGFDNEELESFINFEPKEDDSLDNLEAIDSVAPEIIKIECLKVEKDKIISKLKEVLKNFEAEIKS
jgi:ParB-like chromosome segregation protein Spo0J